jgi:hypothetical protein
MRAPVVAGRSRPGDSPGRELAAGLATAAVVGQFLFARATLVIAVTLIAVGRTSRWRPPWLLLPALAGLGWLLAQGAAPTAFAALPRGLAGPLVRQLPSAVLLGSAEAALVLWVVWYPLAWRSGLVAVLRRRASVRALRAGHTVAPDGFAFGLVTGTGKPVTVTWAEAERGVLITGQNEVRLGELGLAAACAAMRLRKAVLMADLSGNAAAATVGMAKSLGVPVTSEPESSEAPELGLAVRRRSVVVVSPGAAQVVRDLIGVLESLREHDLRADCLVCISGSERLELACLHRLLELGPATGTALLFSSAGDACVAAMAPRAQLVVAEGAITGNLAMQLASQATMEGREWAIAAQSGAPVPQRRPDGIPVIAANLIAQRSGEFTVLARRASGRARTSRPCALPGCLLVPVDVKP